MLNKLLKYDLKWCFKPLLVFYILAIFFAFVIRIVESINQTMIVVIIDKICCGIFISMVISIIINCFMRNLVRFIRNIYKDEAYLTHTLPVSKNKIYLSKVLTVVITLLTSFVIIIISLGIAILNRDTWDIVKYTIEQSAVYFDSSVLSFILVIAVTIFFEFMFMILCGFLGIIIGHKHNNLKIVKSIIAGFLIYILFSVMSLGILYIAGFVNSDIMDIFNNALVSSNTLKSTMFVSIVIYFVYNIAIYFIGNRLLNKGADVD